MSGGSFDYLCFKEADEIIGHAAQLRAMACVLEEEGFKDAALATEDVIVTVETYLRVAGVRVQRLQPVWQAMEWWKSCDWSRDKVVEAVEKWRREL